MKSIAIAFFSLLSIPLLHAESIVYQGDEGPGKGKNIVFLASDHEYRGEETCPALARILAKNYGFKCTVVFGVDAKGFIEAGSSRITGLEALKDADLFVIFARFLNPPDDQMAAVEAYLDRGGPVVGLRTSSHSFQIPASAKYARYDYQSKTPGFENGFGQQILGNTWVGHYGENHKQGTRIELVAEQKDNVILKGVQDHAFCQAGAYVGKPGPDFTVLTKSQPLVSMDPKADADSSKPPMPSTWTRSYKSKSGKVARVFHSTQGASEDILDENYRRLIINGIFWAAGMESSIKPDLDIAFIGPFQPSTFSFGGYVKSVAPADLKGWESPIMPKK